MVIFFQTGTLQNIKHNISELITTDSPVIPTSELGELVQCACTDLFHPPSTTPLTILSQLSEDLVTASVASLVESNVTYWNETVPSDNEINPYLSDFDPFQSTVPDRLSWWLAQFDNLTTETPITSTITTSQPTPTEAVRFETQEVTEETTSSYCLELCANLLETTTSSGSELEFRKKLNRLNYTMSSKLRNHCWETMFGQELIKLTVMDLFVCGISVLVMDFFRY